MAGPAADHLLPGAPPQMGQRKDDRVPPAKTKNPAEGEVPMRSWFNSTRLTLALVILSAAMIPFWFSQSLREAIRSFWWVLALISVALFYGIVIKSASEILAARRLERKGRTG
jgi:hypothetical protein